MFDVFSVMKNIVQNLLQEAITTKIIFITKQNQHSLNFYLCYYVHQLFHIN